MCGWIFLEFVEILQARWKQNYLSAKNSSEILSILANYLISANVMLERWIVFISTHNLSSLVHTWSGYYWKIWQVCLSFSTTSLFWPVLKEIHLYELLYPAAFISWILKFRNDLLLATIFPQNLEKDPILSCKLQSNYEYKYNCQTLKPLILRFDTFFFSR